MDNYLNDIPLQKNYGEIIEKRLSSMEQTIKELSKTIFAQNHALEDSVALNRELMEKLRLLKPVNH